MNGIEPGITWPYLRRIRLEIKGGGFSKMHPYESDGTQKNLRIAAHVRHTIQGASSTGVVNMWNLSRDSRNHFVRDSTEITISAGWDHGPFRGLKNVFFGTLLASQHQRQGPDIVTTLHLRSRKREAVTKHINDSFPAMQVRDAVIRIARQLDNVSVDEGRVIGVYGRFPEKGYPVSATAEHVLNNLSRTYGFHWYITNGMFATVAKDPDDPQGGFSSSSVVESPYLVEVNPIMVGVRQYRRGIQASVTFNPTIRPGQYLTVRSTVDAGNNGEWRVSSIEHDLDTYAPKSFITHFSALLRQRKS